MRSIVFENAKDWFLLCLLVITCVLLSPIIIPLCLIDDCREENYYKRYF